MSCARLRRGEEGALLVIVLLFLFVLSVAIAALVGYIDSGTRNTEGTRRQRAIQYAADGAIEAQIKVLTPVAVNGNCAQAIQTIPQASNIEDASFNVGPVTLSCGVGSQGDASVNAKNTPKNAILALGTGANDGINLKNNQTISGEVVSHEDILTSGILTVSQGNVTAWGNCTPGAIVLSPTTIPAKTVACNTNGAPPPSPDPAYPPRAPASPLATVPTSAIPACTGGSRILEMPPGIYTNANALSALTGPGGCKKADVMLFRPGVYYFNFPTGSSAWQIADNGGLIVVGGQESGWWQGDNKSPKSGFTPGSMCSTAAGADGVEFIFGGESHVDLSGGGTMELCSWVRTDDTEIAIYQANPASPSYTQPTGCIVLPGNSRCPLVSMGANNSTFIVHGTVYTPYALLDLQVPNNAQSALIGRGVIVQGININIPSSNPNRTAISVPAIPCLPCTQPFKDVLLTANVGGRDRIRALVHFENGQATILQWNVLR